MMQRAVLVGCLVPPAMLQDMRGMSPAFYAMVVFYPESGRRARLREVRRPAVAWPLPVPRSKEEEEKREKAAQGRRRNNVNAVRLMRHGDRLAAAGFLRNHFLTRRTSRRRQSCKPPTAFFKARRAVFTSHKAGQADSENTSAAKARART